MRSASITAGVVAAALLALRAPIDLGPRDTGELSAAGFTLGVGHPTGAPLSMVLQQLAQQTAVNKLAGDIGLGVSEDRLGKMVREDPSFQGTLGNFDRSNFTAVLQRSGYTEAEYFLAVCSLPTVTRGDSSGFSAGAMECANQW